MKNNRQLESPGGAQKAGAVFLESGPHKLEDLARLFEALHPNVLASAWLATFIDSLSELPGVPIAEVARALNVVAVKLNHRPAQHLRRICKAPKLHHGKTTRNNDYIGNRASNLRSVQGPGPERKAAAVLGRVSRRARMRACSLVQLSLLHG